MSPGGLGFVVLVISALCLFGCVLGYASWEETRARKRAQKSRARVTQTPVSASTSHPHKTALST
jgi:hypothetical protein